MVKYRRGVFDGDALCRLRTIFAKTCADFEAQLIEMDGEDDHVHLLVEYPPKVAVSNLVNSLKGVLWSPPYFASSCGGAPISIVRQYIEQQQCSGQIIPDTLLRISSAASGVKPRLNVCGRC